MKQSLYEWIFQEGYELGYQFATQKDRPRFMANLLEAKFGPLHPVTRQLLEELSEKELRDILKGLYSARSLTDLGLPDGGASNMSNP